MTWRGYHWTVNLTYEAEKLAGRTWHRLARDGVSAGWFDNVPAWAYMVRKHQERKHPRT